mmetsp:Transcript_69431/g.203789  ORF Transcript_69431/g.203789 Transcript_69431/m.203789 type:complete len:96 (+) Transcript_69431:207-494(+)
MVFWSTHMWGCMAGALGSCPEVRRALSASVLRGAGVGAGVGNPDAADATVQGTCAARARSAATTARAARGSAMVAAGALPALRGQGPELARAGTA